MGQLNEIPESDITGAVKVVSYVANKNGNQELVQGSMWSPVDVVNHQAWLEIDKHIGASKKKVAAGRVSCLHYYMTANQMDTSLLASYTRQPRWLVCLHLFPFFFRRLGAKSLKKYGEVFKVSPDDLRHGILKPPVYNQRECEGDSVD
ncbi:hypothetical protein [Desulforhopalus sp. IMCC35007]|uniref:hypothetical protein n=1 Tax=Desulforhopalus sp. IMCC35007 TaxID=2569543 RepID=UPI0010AE7933|nr:hypothetical protein [Desulforhopalus sp. IMCC35007]TKB10803.1 hypothetical protein FCL48_06130 [Desulforhopalus sp. IMCC35007]